MKRHKGMLEAIDISIHLYILGIACVHLMAILHT